MRIKYSIKNSFRVFNDSMGIALNRENIIRSKKVKYLSYLTTAIIEIFVCVIFLILMLVLNKYYYCLLSLFLSYFATFLLIFIVINILYPLLFSTCFILREDSELEINDKGISFYFEDDECVTLGWTRIRALIIGKYSINFITDDNYYFYLDKKYRREVIKAIKQYNESLLIIR